MPVHVDVHVHVHVHDGMTIYSQLLRVGAGNRGVETNIVIAISCAAHDDSRRAMATLMEQADPRQEYIRRIDTRRDSLCELKRRDDRLVAARLVVVAWAIVVAWAAHASADVSAWWLSVPVLVFLGLVIIHARTIRALRRTERSIRFYEHGMARLDDRWEGRGPSGEEYETAGHPYAAGMNLFGPGSLFQLLSAARTEAGERILASWLLAPASAGEIRERQAAVEEMRNRLDLREDIFLFGDDVRVSMNPALVQKWGEAPPVLWGSVPRILAGLLPMATIAMGTLFILELTGPVPAALALCAQCLLAWLYRRRVRTVIGSLDGPTNNLMLLHSILQRLEAEPFTSPYLVRLHQELISLGRPATQHLRRLALLKDLFDSRHNQLLAPFAALVLWATQIAFAVESWRRVNGHAVAKWLTAIGTFEAVSSLAGYAYEHPADPFPEITDDHNLLDGQAMGHPLLPQSQCVRNSVHMVDPLRLLIVSGSNMSGKSTLLRVIGVNVVLAQAGAPVRADRMRLSPVALGSTLGIQDSLHAGASRFYAEITRIRQMADLTGGGRAVLFLLDELLHGTNSHDRAIGAEGVLRSLLGRGAMGVATTHDLALTSLAARLAPAAANYHFEDRLENGRMVFDYSLRPGVVMHSNAIELMRSVGLDV